MSDEGVFPQWKAFLGTETAEKPENFVKSVVKRSGEIEPYDRNKILIHCLKKQVFSRLCNANGRILCSVWQQCLAYSDFF